MNDTLETPASLLGRFVPWGRATPGELTLANGVVSFTPTTGAAREPLFSVPVGQVKARYPKLYFGLGLKLIVDSKGYRLWLLPMRSAAGDRTIDGDTIVVGNKFNANELGPARAATRTWRAALSGTRT
ncbi:MAG TPA: hypothetical protein VGS60_10575 [Actinomycetes bacterium]|jgi:hypothetical protein|nr:hypothetical protein [Actinomycetes bacterium]